MNSGGQPELAMKAHYRARPIRVAFLVEEVPHWAVQLNAIFADCFSRWGGRFNLIVPIIGNSIPAEYLSWLDVYDPDIIYSYVDLSSELRAALHDRFAPSYLVRHRNRSNGHEEHDYRPNLPIKAVSSLTTSLITVDAHPIEGRRPVQLIDYHANASCCRFLQDNFGYVRASTNSWGLAAQLNEYAQLVTFVPPEIAAEPRLTPTKGETVSSESDLIELVSKRSQLCGLAQLSAWVTPRLEMKGGGWAESVSIIVGAGFVDRISFWNARSHYPSGLDQGLVILNITKEELEDERLFRQFAEIVRTRANVSGHNSQSFITIRSASVPLGELEAIRDRFKALKSWKLFLCKVIGGVVDCVPPTGELDDASRYVEHMPSYRLAPWTEADVALEKFRLPGFYPKHFQEVSPVPAWARDGAWAIDIDLERSNDHSPYSNVVHRWRLSRRLPSVGAFVRSYQLDGHGHYLLPRVSIGGLITIYGNANTTLPEIHPPSDGSLFRDALCGHHQVWPFIDRDEKLSPPPVWGIRPSDKGRYLNALLHRSGGISNANSIFLSGYWKGQFETLGSTSAGTDVRVSHVVSTLQARFSAASIVEDDDWERLARVVLKEAKELRLAPRYLRFDWLQKKHDQFTDDFFERFRARGQKISDERIADEKRSLARSLQYLCQLEILHQGHAWQCPRCFNDNWVSVDNFKSMLECEVCGTGEPAPVSQVWKFKLNQFILEGLREHGLLALLWCLVRLRDESKMSFYFCGPHELFYSDPGSRSQGARLLCDAEFDLLVVTDGVVRLCEVKTSKGHKLGKLIALAKRIRPHIVTLAIMEPNSVGLENALDNLRKALEPSGIKTELMTLKPGDISDSPYLPYELRDHSPLA